MRRTLLSLGIAIFFVTTGWIGTASAADCYICTRDSSGDCKESGYCNPGGSDTSENRKKCQNKGCKIGGTASCPTAANAKICKASAGLPELETMQALNAIVNDNLLACVKR
jgi:hypothetical protein